MQEMENWGKIYELTMKLKRDLNLKPSDFAKCLGVSYASIYSFENDRYSPINTVYHLFFFTMELLREKEILNSECLSTLVILNQTLRDTLTNRAIKDLKDKLTRVKTYSKQIL